MEDTDKDSAPDDDRADSHRELLPGKVLLVEDDDMQARVLSSALKGLGEGWQVVRVSSGEEALKLLETITFSVVIVDFVLPGLSGLDVLREVQARGWTVATILVTAHGSETTAVEALRLGISDYVRKETGYVETLKAAVLRVVAEKRRRLGLFSSHSRLQVALARRSQLGLLDSFAAPIVHDIKNPLFLISGTAERLLLRGIVGDELKSSLSRIIQKADYIDLLLQRLLQFARQEYEERVVIDVESFLTGLVHGQEDHLRIQNVRLHLEPVRETMKLCAAAGALEQVFLNLIANAAEAMASAYGGGQITLAVKPGGSGVAITVTDTGPGLPPEVMSQLFRPFASFGKGHRGTGLGLPIAAGIIREHGGHLTGERIGERGTRFTIWLPAAEQGPVALVLEDESTIQELVQSQLGVLGIKAEIHEDGASVLALIDTGMWDLIVLDIRTPTVGGFEILQAMSSRRPDLLDRTMIVSGCIADHNLQDLLFKHPIPCLPKPYSVRDFNDVVRLLLRRRSEA